MKGWQFWHQGRYHPSKLLLQSVVDGKVVALHKALPSMLCFKCVSLNSYNPEGPSVRAAHAGASCSGGSAFSQFALGIKDFRVHAGRTGPRARGSRGIGLLCCIPVHAGLPASTSALHGAIMPTPLQEPIMTEPPPEQGGMEGDQELQNLQSCGNAQAC